MTTMLSPAALESQSLQFRQLCKLQTINDNSKTVYKNRTQLVATCSLYGLIFVGEKSGIKVLPSSKIYENSHNFSPKTVLQSYLHRNVLLPSPPTHIEINADQKFLSVTFNMNETPVLRIYSIESFFATDLIKMNEVRLSSVAGVYINDLTWNPAIPNMLACCTSDGILTMYTFGPGSAVNIKSLPAGSNSTCACWSPKGKQIVVGNVNGYLTQYTPELKSMKNFPPPSNIFTKPCTITSLKWLSPFQFIGVYCDQEQFVSNDEEFKLCICIVNAPKNSPVTYVKYDDICYSSGTSRPNQFYLLHVPQWNLLFVASANAMEIGVLNFSKDENLWYQLNLEESARVVLPMNNFEETYPVGVAIDFSSQIQTAIGDKIIPMPVLSMLTDEGLLCLYLINNFHQSVECVCTQSNPNINLQHFTTENITVEAKQEQFVPQTPPSAQITAAPAPQMSTPTSQFGFASNTVPVSSTAVSFNQPTMTSNLNSASYNVVNSMNSMFGSSLINSNMNQAAAQMKTVSQQIFPVQQSQVITPPVTQKEVSDTQNVTPIQTMKYAAASPTPEPPPAPQAPVEDAAQKALHVQKLREEALKKLKKRATTFESEIHEFKQLTNDIKVQTGTRPCDKIISQFETKNGKLKELNDLVRNEIDDLKTSIIEVTACVKDIKSKHFLLANPGYRSLSSAQSLDPSTASSLKNIEKNIYYVQSQIELADKQLDEMWYKFCENSPESTTQIPKLENIYRTIVMQQKILKGRKHEMQSLEKKLKDMRYRMSFVQPSSSSFDDYSSKSYESSYSKEDQALAELTKKVLSLESESKNPLDPISLSEKCVKEHAKRFHLSVNKQLKLQELHASHTVNFIRSAKLQRLKKKSLIILSKSTITQGSSPTKVEASLPAPVQRQALISPVSSDDDADRVPVNRVLANVEKVVSSTPVKSGASTKFTMESFVEEPSVIIAVSQGPPKLEPEMPKALLSLPSSVSAFRVSKVDEKPPVLVAEKDKENVDQNVSSTSNVTFGTLGRPFQNSNTIAANSVPSSLFFGAKPSTGSPTATSGSFFGGLKLAPSTTANVIPSVGATLGGSVFAQSLSSIVATNMNVLKDVTGALNLAQKTETVKPQPVPEQIQSPSLFARLTQSVAETVPTAVSTTSVTSTEATGGLFKTVSSSVTPLPSASVSQTVTPAQSVASTVSIVTGSLFGKSATIPAPPAAAATVTTSSIFGTSSLFGKPQTTSQPSSTDTINFGSVFATPKPQTTAATESINFGSVFSSSSLFGTKPQVAATVAPTLAKNDVSASFTFAVKPTTSTVTISEITESSSEPETTSEESAASVINTFSFANAAAVAKSEPETSSLTITPVTSPVSVAPTTPVNVISSAPAVVTPPVSSATPVSSSMAFSGSFFGGLSISATTTTASTMGSIFGKPVATNAAFGGNVFPQQATTTTTATESKPVFGSGSSIFGKSATPENKSLFGDAPQSNQENKPLFGQSQTANQENKSVFGQSANQEKSLFGQAPTSTAAQETKSVFGQSQPVAAAQENKSVFGQSQGTFQSSGSSIFGSGGGSSMFGSGNAFSGGVPTTQSNTFGTTGGSLFGSGAFNNTSANSSFQGTTGGFGSPTNFSNAAQPPQGSAGFGSPPAFSSVYKPNNQFSAFGGAPSFGGSPSFGGTSPTKLFGQNTPAMGNFGNNTPQPTAFENLANENTMTFGNLAQQQPQSPGFGSPPTFGAAQPQQPTFGSGFGGQSFSSWR